MFVFYFEENFEIFILVVVGGVVVNKSICGILEIVCCDYDVVFMVFL